MVKALVGRAYVVPLWWYPAIWKMDTFLRRPVLSWLSQVDLTKKREAFSGWNQRWRFQTFFLTAARQADA